MSLDQTYDNAWQQTVLLYDVQVQNDSSGHFSTALERPLTIFGAEYRRHGAEPAITGETN